MVDHVNDKDLSEFILAGTHHCCSVPFQAPPDDLTGIKCADIHKSYARPQDCRFYEECKFPNKITRFSPTNCVEGPGLYLIKNIDWSQATTKFNDSKTRVGPRRAASGRAWNWLMSRRRLDGEFELIRLLLTEEGTEGVSPCRVCVPRVVRPTRAVWRLELSAVDSVWIVVAGDLWSRYYGPMLAQYHVHITR